MLRPRTPRHADNGRPTPLGPALLLGLLLCSAPPASAFDFEDVARRARDLARKDYVAPDQGRSAVPEWLLELSYDEWRDIRFRTEQSLWKDSPSPFQAQFFHPGKYYDRSVVIHVVDAQGTHELPFSPDEFDYGKNDFASRIPQDLGYAGFRLHTPLNRPDYHDEVAVFVGASYFRAIGKGQNYGISARGLAIDTGLPKGEEFPWFREFWLVRPAADAASMQVYALLDSDSVTGAYEFVITPGEQTIVETRARIFPRTRIEKLGLAPLTSMFFHGENTPRHFNDFRPEVHDSDGLMIHAHNGEWIWRPVDNPAQLAVSGFHVTSPKGFGLAQRDRNFDHYQDLETRQEMRPSLWVEPLGDWGQGRIELVEIPTHNDENDNIVAFWVPDAAVEPGQSLDLHYRTHWYLDHGARPPGGHVVATRRDRVPQQKAARFILDFQGEQLERLAGDSVVRARITAVRGDPSEGPAAKILHQYVIKNPVTGGWRLSFMLQPPDDQPVELRAFLEKDDEVLTETWTYTLRP